MTTDEFALSKEGFYELPPGMLATIVTSLEMRAQPPRSELQPQPATELRLCSGLSADDYRKIYLHVGQDWLWYSRLLKTAQELTAIIENDRVAIYQVFISGRAEGLLELDYRLDGECEIAFVGLSTEHTGQGHGTWLMSEALRLAWSQPITRLWLHTCTFDHPRALAFYQRLGFTPYKQEVELVHDPRLDGTLPMEAAAHIPLIAHPSR